MSIVGKIPGMDDNKLLVLFNNAINAEIKGVKVDEAKIVIDAIQLEWARRLQNYNIGKYKASSPEEGMLKSLGYKVGNQGVPLQKRRKILDFIMTGTLPPVGSPAYVAEWGEPRSRQRYRKLHRVIRVLASSAHADWEKAREEWEFDLIYLEEVWRQQAV